MGFFFWKNKNTPYGMMLKFQEKTKNKNKNKKSTTASQKMNQLWKIRSFTTIRKNQVKSQVNEA